jgi:hypothetical protein
LDRLWPKDQVEGLLEVLAVLDIDEPNIDLDVLRLDAFGPQNHHTVALE